VRTRLSIQSASFAELGAKPKKLPGMWQTMIAMYKTEGGVRALYRGIVPTVAGVAPYVCGPDGSTRREGILLIRGATGRP
jgi:solute carrier family 25 phosphate transporter 23/24/25/41